MLIHEENERMRLWDELLWHQQDDKQRNELNHREDEDQHCKKQKEQKYKQLPQDDYDDIESR